MIEATYLVILVAAGLVAVSVLSSLVSMRFGAPLLLVFLVIGLLAGVDGPGGIRFDDAKTAYLIGSLALAIILFDSGFATPWRSFRLAAAPAITLATLGVVLTTAGVGLFAHWVLGLDLLSALLLGAILGSTDAAAVFFLLRVGGITIREKIRATLEIESGSNDPMAIFLTITLVELLLAHTGDPKAVGLSLLGGFLLQMGLGLVLGWLGGKLIVLVINRLDLDAGLYPIIALNLALVLFAVTGILGGSGFLAVYIAGLVAGNAQLRARNTLSRFHDGITWLAQIGMFLALGLLATPSEFPTAFLPAIGVALVLMFVARPLAVMLCLAPFRLRWRETAFIGWVGLRGAVSILLAIVPLMAGLPLGELFFNIAFIVVLASLLLQGWTVGPLARRLGLVVPARDGTADRLELDLPDNVRYELVTYRLPDNCAALKLATLPRWARPSLIVRDGRALKPHQSERLMAGDHVYLFVHPGHVRLLDRLFGSPRPLGSADREFFGDFAIGPDARLGELAEYYQLDLGPGLERLTACQMFAREFAGRAEVGDRIHLGQIDLIARAIDANGRVSEIGLAVHKEPGD